MACCTSAIAPARSFASAGRAGRSPFASLPSSVAAYHLAWSAVEGVLYASVPTLATRDAIYRIDRHGGVTTVYDGFGRPQGLAVDAEGALYVAEALAGSSGIYRLRPGQGRPSSSSPARG